MDSSKYEQANDEDRKRYLEILNKSLRLKHECEVLKRALRLTCKHILNNNYEEEDVKDLFEDYVTEAIEEINEDAKNHS